LQQEVVQDVISNVPLHIPQQAMVTQWFQEQDCLYKIWNLSNSIQQVFMEQVV
jgi:hypothetical protein